MAWRPSTLGTKDTLKNFADARDSLWEVESENFQKLTTKMIYHSLDDPMSQFEMAGDVGHVQANGRSTVKDDEGALLH